MDQKRSSSRRPQRTGNRILAVAAVAAVLFAALSAWVLVSNHKVPPLLAQVTLGARDTLQDAIHPPKNEPVKPGPLRIETFRYMQDGAPPKRTGIIDDEDKSPVIVIIPHPDDEAFALSGTVATLVANKVPVRMYSVSDGEGAKVSKQWVHDHQSPRFDYNGDKVIDLYDFALARRDEFKASAKAMGLSGDSVVFLGNGYKNTPLKSLQPTDIASFIKEDCASHGFPIDSDTRIFTVAPMLGSDSRARFFGEDFHKRNMESPLHRVCAYTATRFPEVLSKNIYFFDVYAHDYRIKDPAAPLEFALSDSAVAARRRSVMAYRDIGKKSVELLYRGSLEEHREYGATLEQIQDAGYTFPH